jgi:hypothetical protein
MRRHGATFVDKLLAGAKPAELPVEQATKFVTIVDLKTAKAIGVEVPTSLLLRADKIVERSGGNSSALSAVRQWRGRLRRSQQPVLLVIAFLWNGAAPAGPGSVPIRVVADAFREFGLVEGAVFGR